MNKNSIKIALAVALLLCLLDMPYGYYQLVRFMAMIGFGYLAYEANQSRREIESYIFIVLVILFQPLFKIALGRGLWNFIDLIVALGLLFTVFKKKDD